MKISNVLFLLAIFTCAYYQFSKKEGMNKKQVSIFDIDKKKLITHKIKAMDVVENNNIVLEENMIPEERVEQLSLELFSTDDFSDEFDVESFSGSAQLLENSIEKLNVKLKILKGQEEYTLGILPTTISLDGSEARLINNDKVEATFLQESGDLYSLTFANHDFEDLNQITLFFSVKNKEESNSTQVGFEEILD